MIKVEQRLYDAGYVIDGEKNRIMVKRPEGPTECELICVENGEVILMSKEDFIWCMFKDIEKISLNKISNGEDKITIQLSPSTKYLL